MDSLSSVVWKRTGRDHMSRSAFNLAYMVFTILGLAVTAVIAINTMHWVEFPVHGKAIFNGPCPFWLLVVTALLLGIGGSWIALATDKPIISLFGYMLMAVPFGVIMGPITALYTPASVVKVLFVTTGVVVGLGMIGAIIPKSLESWGAWLMGALLILIISQIAVPIAASMGAPLGSADFKLLDWIGILLFSGYVVYDANRAQRVPATLNNSIECAVGLYLDFANLFLRLLELMGDSKSDD